LVGSMGGGTVIMNNDLNVRQTIAESLHFDLVPQAAEATVVGES